MTEIFTNVKVFLHAADNYIATAIHDVFLEISQAKHGIALFNSAGVYSKDAEGRANWVDPCIFCSAIFVLILQIAMAFYGKRSLNIFYLKKYVQTFYNLLYFFSYKNQSFPSKTITEV